MWNHHLVCPPGSQPGSRPWYLPAAVFFFTENHGTLKNTEENQKKATSEMSLLKVFFCEEFLGFLCSSWGEVYPKRCFASRFVPDSARILEILWVTNPIQNPLVYDIFTYILLIQIHQKIFSHNNCNLPNYSIGKYENPRHPVTPPEKVLGPPKHI